MSRRLQKAVIGILSLFAVNLNASAKDWPPTVFVAPCSCKGNHGEDRWAAKTNVEAIPRDISVIHAATPSAMFGWKPLAGLTDTSPRSSPLEEQWYQVRGRVVEVKAEADGDIHFALQDASGRKRGRILAEVPYGASWCDLRKVVFSWTKKGQQFSPFNDSGSALPLASHPVVTVTGRAFFDTHHATKRPLTNRNLTDHTHRLAAWEIHPVAQIETSVQVRRAIPVGTPRSRRKRA